MNRENVSTKIAAGMDRWQNTLEEMIHLRSSNNQAFKDNYWVSLSTDNKHNTNLRDSNNVISLTFSY